MPTKIVSMLSFKANILHAKFCTIPCNKIRNRTILKILGKTEYQLPLLSYIYPNITIVISNYTFLYINFCSIPFTRNRVKLIPKILEKVQLQRHLLSDFYQKLIDINLRLDDTKYRISLNSVLYLELRLPQNFCHTHIQTDIFQK